MNQARGTLARWIEEKGFGFIRPDDGDRDVFVHIRDFGGISRKPKVGDVVRYQPLNDGTGKYRAADVSIEGVSRLPSGRPARLRSVSSDQKTSTGVGGIVMVTVFSAVIVGFTVLGKVPVVVAFIYLISSCCTFIAYAFDKSAAMNRRWRTQESTLHLLSMMGGWPGALIAQKMFRHKSKKTEFLIIFWMTVAMNCGLLGWSATEHGRSLIRALVG